MSGFFLTLDGPGGVGKSTALAELYDLITARGFTVVGTTEPSRTPLGQLLRESTGRYRGRALAHLIAGDRIDHIDGEVAPALDRGEIVVCDRYIASSLVLQRMDGVPVEDIWALNQPLVKPDLSIIVTAEQAEIEKRLDRRGERHSRFEEMEDGVERELRYYRDATAFLRGKGFSVFTVDSTCLTPAQVAARIVSEVIRTYPLKGRARA